MTRTFRLAIVAPSDVGAERRAVRSAVMRFNDRYEGRFKVIVTSSDQDMAPDLRRAQSVAFEDIGFSSADIIVGILWSRMGTPPGSIDPQTGEPYPSGTAEELAEAARLVADGKVRALVYECTRPVPLLRRFLPSNQRWQVAEYCRHLRTEKHFHVPSFDSADEFEKMVLVDLERLLPIAKPPSPPSDRQTFPPDS